MYSQFPQPQPQTPHQAAVQHPTSQQPQPPYVQPQQPQAPVVAAPQPQAAPPQQVPAPVAQQGPAPVQPQGALFPPGPYQHQPVNPYVQPTAQGVYLPNPPQPGTVGTNVPVPSNTPPAPQQPQQSVPTAPQAPAFGTPAATLNQPMTEQNLLDKSPEWIADNWKQVQPLLT